MRQLFFICTAWLHFFLSGCFAAKVADPIPIPGASTQNDHERRVEGNKIIRIMPTQYTVLSSPYVHTTTSAKATTNKEQHCFSVSVPPRMNLVVLAHAPDLNLVDAQQGLKHLPPENSLGGEPPLHRNLLNTVGEEHHARKHHRGHATNKYKEKLEKYKEKLSHKVEKITHGEAGTAESRAKHRMEHDMKFGKGSDHLVGDVRVVIRERGDIPLLGVEKESAEASKGGKVGGKAGAMGKAMLNHIMGQVREVTHVLTEKIEKINFKTELGGTVDICARSLSASKSSPSRIGIDVSMSRQELSSVADSSPQLEKEASAAKTSMSSLLEDVSRLQDTVAEILAEADFAKTREVIYHRKELQKHSASFW
eukprot:CAMPEP_0194307048 /NCGR_PEP_ID=MMETSP0171-20130528/3945_1 /TAXON_ID=218684 /ORGANISM="Corethron pennatum, Strain L29A3" /LENGTH=365 /DNA_ID=CAMNT_0039058927 /DNA_START=85 /DNA_END=1179 /DNA_ORIENTATION=+